jgi:hypothetical protein
MIKKERLGKHFKIYFFLTLFLFFYIFLINIETISAVQTQIALKECKFSFNDDNFGPWDEGNQKGVYLMINNSNPVIGQSSSFRNIYYQTPRVYYNNFNYTSFLSYIPLLQVNTSNENMIYTLCTYVTGNYTVRVTGGPSMLYSTGLSNTYGLFLTTDFNLTTELVNQSTPYYSSLFAYGSPYSRYTYVSFQYGTDSVYYAFNGEITASNNSILINEGFQPYSESIVKTKLNLTSFPTGLFMGYGDIRAFAVSGIIDSPSVPFFYINSTTRNLTNFLFPRVQKWNFFNLNTSAFNPPAPFLIGYKDSIGINITIINDFNASLNVTSPVSNIFRILSHYGVSRNDYGADIQSTQRASTAINFTMSAKSIKVMNYTVVLNLNQSLYRLSYVDSIYYLGPNRLGGSIMYTTSQPIGSDDVPYLGFQDSASSLKGSILMLEGNPYLNFTATVFLENSSAIPNLSIGINNYSLLFDIRDASTYSTSNSIKNYSFFLNQSVFSSLGITSIPPLRNTGISVLYPIDFLLAQNKPYYLDAYTIRTSLPSAELLNKKIAAYVFNPLPLLAPGNFVDINGSIILSSDNRSKYIDFKLFNPSFYYTNLSISLLNFSNDPNIEICDNSSGTYDCNYPKNISFNPVEIKTINLRVRALYPDWSWSNIDENPKLSASVILNLVKYTDSGNFSLSIDGACTVECESQNYLLNNGGCWVNRIEKKIYECASNTTDYFLRLSSTCNPVSPSTICKTNTTDINDGNGTIEDGSTFCTNFSLWNTCLIDGKRPNIQCSWNTANYCPPSNISLGNCINCNDLTPRICETYRNNQSCIADNCKLASGYGFLSSENPRCAWANYENRCSFVSNSCNITMIPDGDCSNTNTYSYNLIKTVTKNSPLAICPASELIVVPCDKVALSFFSNFSLIISILVIFVAYLFFSFRHKMVKI